MSILKKHRLQ